MERDRLLDLKERNKRAKRLNKKDKEKRKSKKNKESAQNLHIENEEKERVLPKLRKESRRKYLTKREEEKLLELQDGLREEDYLFEESQLTAGERKEKEYKKSVLDLAMKHEKQGQIKKVQRYQMPDKDRKDWG
jgi:pre-mRNA-splicing factor ATP-dependent RNA helicase DHX16